MAAIDIGNILPIHPPQNFHLGQVDASAPARSLYDEMNSKYDIHYRAEDGLPMGRTIGTDILLRTVNIAQVISTSIDRLERSLERLDTQKQEVHKARHPEHHSDVDPSSLPVKPALPSDVLRDRVENTWLGWTVCIIETYDGFLKCILEILSDFLIHISESYSQECDYQLKLKNFADQNVHLADLRGLPNLRNLREPQGVIYDTVYAEYCSYVQQLVTYQQLVQGRESLKIAAQKEYNLHYLSLRGVLDNHSSRFNNLEKLMAEPLTISENYFANGVGQWNANSIIYMGFRSKFDELFTEAYGYRPWVQLDRNKLLCIALKNPEFDPERNDTPKYFLLTEFHDRDQSPGQYYWRVISISPDADQNAMRPFRGYKVDPLLSSDVRYCLDIHPSDRDGSTYPLHRQLKAAISAANEACAN